MEDKEDLLIRFQIWMSEKGLINDYDWEFEKEAKKYLKTLKVKKPKNRPRR